MVAEKSWEDPDAEPAVMLREAFYEANNFIYNRGKEPGMAGTVSYTHLDVYKRQHERLLAATAGLLNKNGV